MEKVNSFNPKKFVSDNAIILLVVLLAIFTAFNSDNFVSQSNFKNLIINMAPRFIIACGVSGCLITKGTDLSAGRQVGLAACLAAMMLQDITYAARMLPWFPDIPWFAALLIVMVIMGIIGAITFLTMWMAPRDGYERSNKFYASQLTEAEKEEAMAKAGDLNDTDL